MRSVSIDPDAMTSDWQHHAAKPGAAYAFAMLKAPLQAFICTCVHESQANQTGLSA